MFSKIKLEGNRYFRNGYHHFKSDDFFIQSME